ncbi:MAG: DUF7305 domain-containing protein [Planctomycetota bacterium]|jgi:choice-of-anchor A domain-containing protein
MNEAQKLKRKGSAVIMVLFLTIVLLITGAGILTMGKYSRFAAIQSSSGIAARCSADAGLTKALFEMNQILESTKKATGIWSDASLPYVVDETLLGCDATFSYQVEKSPGGDYAITSVGKSGKAQRMVSTTLQLKSLFEYAILTDGVIELKNGTTIDAYNIGVGDPGPTIATNSTAGSSVISKLGVTINGDVAVGPGGDPSIVINSKNEAVITGDTYPMVEEEELDLLTVPSYLEALPSKGVLSGDATITTNSKYDSFFLPGTGNTIIIDGPVELYVVGDITIANTDEIRIVDVNTNPNAYLILYVGGDIIFSNGSAVNNLTQDTNKMKIFGLATCTSIDFQQTSNFYGTIYAPNADVKLYSSNEFYGAVVSKSFTQAVGAGFHYDASLRDVSIDDIGVSFVVNRWNEE